MKRAYYLYGLFLIMTAFFTTSCTEDGGPIIGGGNDLESPPSLSLSVEGVFGTETVNLASGEVFVVNLSISSGTSPLDVLRITENGELVDASRILQDGQLISGNPKLILGNEKDGVSYELTITASSEELMSNFTFAVEDENDLIQSASVSVSTMNAGPSVTNLSSGIFQVAAGSLIELQIDALPGSSDLSFIVVSNAEIIEDASRFFYGDIMTPFNGNPFFIPEEDKKGFSKSIFIRAHEGVGELGYRIFVFDENEEAAFVDISITVGEPTNNIFGVLFNAAGPEGSGGLDLDEGLGTGSASMLAEIKDEGIDLNQPIMDNWKRQIAGVNGSIVRSLVPGMNGLGENYNFMNDYLRGELAVLFDAGIDFTVTNANDEIVSSRVNVGDSFVVQNGENYYLIIIREVNETGDDNVDNYVIDIKL